MKIIAVGPYIGDFETEITSFRPYVVWHYCNEKFDRFYISSHSERAFLYHWVPCENFIPVRKDLICKSQKCYFNEAIDHNQYLKLVRKFRNDIYNMSTDVEKEDIKIFSPAYTKLADPVHYNKKLFTSIKVEHEFQGFILFEDEVYFDKYTYRRLSEIESYEEKIAAICSAKILICEAGIWTVIANMQKVPVFSWSEGAIGKYKEGGEFNFGNKNMIIYSDNQKTMLKTMENYLKQMMGY